MKKLLSVMLSLSVIAAGAACLAEDAAAPAALTMDELTAFAGQIRELAAAEEPENDPHDAEALSDDGYAWIYSFGTVYFSEPEMTDSTVMYGFVLWDEEIDAMRGLNIDAYATDVIAAYPNDNADLDGTEETAVLYLNDSLPESSAWGVVLRDGQRISSIEYSLYTADGDSSADAGIIYTVEDGTVSAIRVYGLNQTGDSETAAEEAVIISAYAELSGYTEYPSSADGTLLTEFCADDLVFDGIQPLETAPEAIIAELDDPIADDLLDNGDGCIRVITFDHSEWTYLTDKDGANAVLDSFLLTDDETEGPRGVRIGDSLNSVLQRFRFGETELSGTGDQPLYGTDGTAPYGVCTLGDDASAELRYAFAAEDGRTCVLDLTFTMLELTGIMVYMI